MKTQIISTTLAAIAALTFFSLPVRAGNSASVPMTGQTTPTLSYGAANVLKLAQANVGEATIIAYIEKSGQGYGNLGAPEIIYLRSQGVSDRAISAMLTQEKKANDTTSAQFAAQQTTYTPSPAVAPVAPAVTAPQYVQPTYVQPAVTYVQTAPAPLIVMRDSSPRLVDYGIYPRYGYGCYPRYNYGCYPSYGYRSYGCSPNVSFSVGYRSGHYGGYAYYGNGYRGGYCR